MNANEVVKVLDVLTPIQLSRVRMVWETVEMVTDPEKWDALAAAFDKLAMIANRDKCKRLAENYRHASDRAAVADLVRNGQV